MSWIAVAAGAGALVGGVSASRSNKKRPNAVAFQPYEGHRPPLPNYTRDVEKQVYETLMRRSQGQDVGFDPRRRDALLENYNIENDRYLDRQTNDIQNRLSGMGLSKNLRAYDALMNRALEDNKRDGDLYRNRVDIEDLTRRSDEKIHNTDQLQAFNNFNFGQENTRANFDLSEYGAEQANRYNSYGTEVQRFNQYQSPLLAGMQGAVQGGSLAAGFQSPSNSGAVSALTDPSDTFRKSYGYYTPPGMGYGGGQYNPQTSYMLRGR